MMPFTQPTSDTTTVKVAPGVRQLSTSARDLLEQAARQWRSVQMGPDWYALMEDTVFPQDPRVGYLEIHGAGGCQAVLPLLLPDRAWAIAGASLANFYTCLYEPALAAGATPAVVAAGLRQLARRHALLCQLRLAPMDPASRAFQILEQAFGLAGWRTKRYFSFGNWYLSVDGGWDRYLASRDGKVRSTIKRMTQRILAEGGQVEVLTGGEGLDRGIRAYEQVYAQSWKKPEPFTTFVPSLIELCARQGKLRLGVVWLGEKAIAAQLWIVSERRAEIYKVAYDEAYKQLSPGTALTAKLMQHVIDVDGVDEVDYLIGDDPYKKSWMGARRERWGLEAIRPVHPVGWMLQARQWAAQAYKRMLARQIVVESESAARTR